MLDGTTGAGGVLKLVRDGRATTRTELAQQSGLSRSTLAERVQSLLALDLLEEATGIASTGGRPPATLTFNRSAGVVLVADLDGSRTRIAVCDLEAAPLAERSFRFDPTRAPGAVLSEIHAGFGALLGDGGIALIHQLVNKMGFTWHERKTDALLRVHLADGRMAQAVLRGNSPFFTVPPRAGFLDVVHAYLALGLEHILTGPDHLLFVLGLVLLVRGRQLLWTITAFTLGHSVTLSLAVLGFVHIPPRPVEALIAGSIFVVAVELTRQAQGRTLWMGRVPWGMACAVGLLHGLGFAGALAQVGLPAHEIPLALVSFNGGIEVGQLLFVGLVLAVRAALSLSPGPWPSAVALIPAYAIGSLAAFWVFERVTAIFF